MKAKAQRDKAKAYREEWENVEQRSQTRRSKERRRTKSKQEEKERRRAKAKQEEWENLVPKIEKRIINIPDDVIEFKRSFKKNIFQIK